MITCEDSGGTNEVIQDGLNGLVVEPSPEALAAAMERLWLDRAYTAAMGENAFETLTKYNITWDHVIESFVA